MRRRLGITGAALTMAAGLGACQVASPVTTELIYNPGEGVLVNIEDIAIRDLQVISQGFGAPGQITGLVANGGEESTAVAITVVSAGEPIAPPEQVTPSTHEDGWPPALSVDSEDDEQPIPMLTAEDVETINLANAEFEIAADVPPSDATQLADDDAEPIPGIVTSGGSLITLEITTSTGASETVVVPVVYPQPGGPFADYDPGPSPYAAQG